MTAQAWPAPAVHEFDRLSGGDPTLARPSDPGASHHAANVAARTRLLAKSEILRLIHELGPVDGQALNAAYAERHPLGDPLHLAWDSPRKRAGEFERDGLVSRLESHIAANNLPAGAYCITVEGLAVIS